ncbi:hypothetical protein SAMN04515660_1024 [Luteibacter sp. 329MFSha]|nr:hypothetical protein SAMN04515660_1024 [Luteibacter sp. 329MFSha]
MWSSHRLLLVHLCVNDSLYVRQIKPMLLGLVVEPFVTPQPNFERRSLAIQGDDDLITDFSSACADLLNRIGFDKNYNPDADGRLLEKLIDDLFE